MSIERIYSHNQAHGHSRQHVGDVHHYHSLGAQQHEQLQHSLRDLSTRNDAHFTRLEHAVTSQADQEKCDKILRKLAYDSIDDRREAIPEAAATTFEWIFQDDASSPITFRSWLTTHTDSGLCWIYGKPGSGKSTLMKFIHDQDTTGDLLGAWAGDRQLLTAQHHFWYPGTNIQKSQEGLLRSLLYQVCSEYIALLPKIFPSRWTSNRAPKPWSVKELIDAIGMLRTVTNAAFCFFIDGLDEYQPEDRHMQLAKDLAGLASSSNIKICVSSRPWETFQAAFGNTFCQLCLEDLTHHDLRDFTDRTIRDAFDLKRKRSEQWTGQIPNLVAEVVSKAKGVFLWVRLVVGALCERIPVAEHPRELLACLNDFPSDLEDYFRSMIYDRINPTWIKGSETAGFLKLALVVRSRANRSSCWHSWRTYYVVSNATLDCDLETALVAPISHLDRREESRTKQRVISKINSSCGGFLTVAEDQRIDFAHRTVHDFLTTTEMQTEIDSRIPNHFLAKDLLARIMLVRCKTFPEEYSDMTSLLDAFEVEYTSLLLEMERVALSDQILNRMNQPVYVQDHARAQDANGTFAKHLEAAAGAFLNKGPTRFAERVIALNARPWIEGGHGGELQRWEFSQHSEASSKHIYQDVKMLVEMGFDPHLFRKRWAAVIRLSVSKGTSMHSTDRSKAAADLQQILELLKHYGLNIQSLSANFDIAYVEDLKWKFSELHTLISQVDSRSAGNHQLESLRAVQQVLRQRLWPPLHDVDSGFLVKAIWSELHERMVWVRDSPSRGRSLPNSIPIDARWVLKKAKHKCDYVDVWESDPVGPSWWKRFELP